MNRRPRVHDGSRGGVRARRVRERVRRMIVTTLTGGGRIRHTAPGPVRVLVPVVITVLMLLVLMSQTAAAQDAPDARPSMPHHEPGHVLGEEGHVGSLQRHLGACGAHCDADIGTRQRRRVIDPVPDKGHPAAFGHAADQADLVAGQQFGVDLLGVEAEFPADPERDGVAVAGHHRPFAHPAGEERQQTGPGTVARAVGDRHRPQQP